MHQSILSKKQKLSCIHINFVIIDVIIANIYMFSCLFLSSEVNLAFFTSFISFQQRSLRDLYVTLIILIVFFQKKSLSYMQQNLTTICDYL